ncbi:hypothetical protein GBF38_022227 [Nibea albiflora]|uniref:Uncharacterized protein n=1 Tax=Nibea albiflora TaxID=240163 RepID=A0ACB7FL24_NIBAL|nr:hypothetical protein GBF38_022227 [Nibea albiflora]
METSDVVVLVSSDDPPMESGAKFKFTIKLHTVKCKVGENLRISLQGIDLADATLYFSGEAGNFTLVRNGARVSQDLPDYFDRVVTQHDRIIIKHVKYADKGRYTVRNRRGRLVSFTRMDLTARVNTVKCKVGENLRISLQGIDLADASLYFSGEAGNFTLVRDGARVSQDLPDYFDRVVTQHNSIIIKHVKYADKGRYTVRNHWGRLVSVTRMDLTGHATSSKRKALLALLLLLGIPAGICYCCLKTSKTEATTTSTLETTPDVVHPPPGGPVGPAPPYNNPGQPGGLNPAYPPQNPVYPPVGPAMVPPAQPPQWSGPPPGQYPPGPTAPMVRIVSVHSYTVPDIYERLDYGRQLKIYLPKSAEMLEFSPADNPSQTYLYWQKSGHRLIKGRVSGTGSDHRWHIDTVTYQDEGTYTQRDYWRKEISTVKVAVTARHNYVKCIAGENLRIYLQGIDLADATLYFSGEAGNFTLVRDGARVSQDLPDYFDRVVTQHDRIIIKHVNYTDEGHYTVRNRRDKEVSITRMDLTDHHETGGNPLMALLLLLGIPAGICCCCRKKIFKKKATTASTLQTTPDVVHPPPGGPVGPAPPYNNPGQPGGFNPAYPPQNPVYPPVGPAMVPPAQPLQWSGAPPGQYPPGPIAPMTQPESAPVAPVAPASSNAATSPGDAYKFQIDGVNSSTNFL